MSPRNRIILIAAGSVVLLIALIITCIPLFLNADSFRTKIETTLSSSLGRKVTLGKLNLSVWSGSLVAENATIADDPAFSNQPFLQAESVKIGVEVMPLLFSKELRIRGFSIESPKITLLHNAAGVWNYSSIGNAHSAKQPTSNDIVPGLTVGHVDVDNGQVTVGTVPAGAGATPDRTYSKLDLDVKDFSFAKQFPYSISASLPAGGSVTARGNAGPINQRDASLTPFSAHVEFTHFDPLAAGFIDATTGISGTIDTLTADALWNGAQLHLTSLLIDTPKLTLASSTAPARPATAAQPPSNTMMNNFALDKFELKNGVISTAAAGKQPVVAYQQLNATLTNFSATSSAPFTVSAQVPGGGSLSASGHAGPLNQQISSATPFDAQVTLKHVDLATSGLLSPDAGVGGTADINAKAVSNGQVANATGTAQVAGIRLAKNASPSSIPVSANFGLSQNMTAQTGTIQNTTINVGKVPISVAGTYQSSGPTTAINLKVATQGASLDELQAFMPALGVHLPPGSRLQGGTLSTSLNVTGSSASPIISGPVSLDNTQLTGFDLGSKLSALNALTGGATSRTGSATAIRSLKMNVRVAGGDIRTDNIALTMPALGSATGNGTVTAAGALNYQMVLKLTALSGGGGSTAAAPAAGGLGQLMGMMIPGAGGASSIGGIAEGALKNGIPVAITGTTANPVFTPDVAALATTGGLNAAQGLLNGKKTQTSPTNNLGNVLGGLLGPKK